MVQKSGVSSEESPDSEPASTLDERKSWRMALGVLVGTAVLRLVLAAAVPLFPDETYYWAWSRQLAPGYFDHPAGIAFMIRLGTELFGATRLGVRLPVVLAGFAASFAVVATARRLSGDTAALRAALIMACMPMAGAGLLLATPDAPLLFAGAWCLYFVVRALEHSVGSRAAWGWWIAAGLALGVGMDSKYTAVLIPFGLLVALLVVRQTRPSLAWPEPYVGGVLGLVLFLPVVTWNARHGWDSFAFQLHHGLGSPRGDALAHEAGLLGGQLGLVSPILFVLMVIAALWAIHTAWSQDDARADARGPRDARRSVLAVVALVIPGFFAVTALFRHVEPNWPAPAYIAATVVLATHTGGRRWRRWLGRGLVLGGALVGLVYVQALYPVLPIPPRRDPIGRAFGYARLSDVARESRRMVEDRGATGHVWIASDTYETASELTYHLEGHPRVFSINLQGRPNQYDLWPRFTEEARPGDALLLVTGCGPGNHPLVHELGPRFREVEAVAHVGLSRGNGVIDDRCLDVLEGWDGSWPSS